MDFTDYNFLKPLHIQGDSEWLKRFIPELKWMPVKVPLFSKTAIENGGIIKLDATEHKFSFSTPKQDTCAE